MNLTLVREFLISRPVRVSRRWIHAAADMPNAFAWIVFAAAIINTAAFIWIFSNPIVQADTWYVLDTFIQKALDGTLQLGDFFAQRGGSDHAQPLRRLLLLIDLRHFHLDLRYQALAGWLGATLSLLLLRRFIFRREETTRPSRGMHVWIWATLCAALVSLNSTNVWTWPLAASAYTSYFFVFATLLGLWRWLKSGFPILLVASVLCLDFVADDTAILVNIACLLALGITAWQNPSFRKRAVQAAAILLGCLILVRFSYALLYTPPDVTRMTFTERMGDLGRDFLGGGWWRWAIIPLGSSVGLLVTLKYFVGDSAPAVQIVIGSLLLLAHVWFWWRVLWKRPVMTAPMFAAIALMLIFYAFLAGILYARIPIYGSNYLNQPRYAMLYVFNLVALLLMCASCKWGSLAIKPFARFGLIMFMALFIVWQIPLSHRAWTIGSYKMIYYQTMAWQVGEMARHPQQVPKHCLPQLTICNYPPSKRAELIHMLESRQLNIFSPTLQKSTGLDPWKPPK